MRNILVAILITFPSAMAHPAEYHVAITGDDANAGTAAAPLRTIQHAADLAQPGDVITVHDGVYRERITPPRGGESDANRILYQAAPGEKVIIKGSEPVQGWIKEQEDAWKVTLPNTYFGAFNPYADEIKGDWFDPRGRKHHTGAVYLDGHWLTEASELAHVFQPVGTAPTYSPGGGNYLLNITWIQPTGTADKILAATFTGQEGVQKAECSEGGECIGFINNGDWVAYQNITFDEKVESLDFRAASATEGGIIEARRDALDGPIIGTCAIPNTGGWQSWRTFTMKLNPVEGVRDLFLVFREPTVKVEPDTRLWFAEVDAANTTIHAQFTGVDPNEADVEINVRQTVFYPDKPGVNYITVRGFSMMHAATPWAPPTSEQIGLIGTHWSKGWIIENNDISYSVCVGVTLGKHGDEFDNTSANSAEGYVKTIERAHAFTIPWTKEYIGHHIVRNNHISYCEQAGVVGSLGAAFSAITGNDIHDIHMRRLFTGAEMAGIKIHAAIDMEISRNNIHRTCLGLWLDWMAQGTQVTRNVFHENGMDLFLEVNHGPCMVDNNLFLSKGNLLDVSEGGAFAHNLFAGNFSRSPEPNRDTPYHPAHSTEVAELIATKGGDDRFYNNLFVDGAGLALYDDAALPMFMSGNVFFKEAKPSEWEQNPVVQAGVDPGLQLVAGDNGELSLKLNAGSVLNDVLTQLVTTDMLGKTAISNLPYKNADGTPIKVDTDFHGEPRNPDKPTPGPFEARGDGELAFKVW